MDWASAEKYCLNLESNLVSIHNEGEYQQVNPLSVLKTPRRIQHGSAFLAVRRN
ncbi:hypothetical protein PGIGA_G00199670 [Pangasianodon gigas]|uniref:Uncharacterized protein n=1 Tax=Pangasianodon gigas TaxID=30993 RepID=A0ACC5WE23_PANGG|nr:hypothetical protein [Pangasianodon gigas]